MADNETPSTKGARIKGEKAALRGKLYVNPYGRPNMAEAFKLGFESVPADKRGSEAKPAKPAKSAE
jgi:hypothetical protein